MSDIHLLTAIAKKYARMSPSERIKKVRKLVAQSDANDRFIRKYYPEFYEEAFPTARAAGAGWGSTQPQTLSAKTR